MSAIHTQICLVSGQPAPNFFSCNDPKYKPQTLYLLVTPQMEEGANNLVKALKKDIRPIHRISILDPDDVESVMETVGKLIEKSLKENNEDGEGILVNITGGTKLMSFAAFSAAQSWGVRSVYISIAKNQNPTGYMLLPKNGSHVLNPLLEIGDFPITSPEKHIEKYLAAHGCELTQKDPKWKKLTDKEKRFVDRFIKALPTNQIKNEALIAKLNLALEKCNQNLQWHQGPQKFDLTKKNYLDLEKKVFPNFKKEFEEFLRDLEEDGWIKLDNPLQPEKFEIQTEEDFNFLHGRWLEKAIAEEISNIHSGFQLYNLEFRFNKGENQNEIDVAFYNGLQLFAIEVKTANLESKKQDVLNKLDAVSTQIGGINTKKCLISYRTIMDNGRKNYTNKDPHAKKQEFAGNNFLELAHSRNITIIQGSDVSNHGRLHQRLKEWIG